jgi:exonuclease SbcC
MTPRLLSLTVENFRSIRGRVSVSLDAPVVLIHGPNGTGKTSLLSAIELGLTGSVSSFARVDPRYVEDLPHKDAPTGEGRISLGLGGIASASAARIILNGQAILGESSLADDDARFFSERCYLAQSTLSRLLEIYQHQDARQSDSPLTRFVKELLGLERFDALIDGLFSAGDVRRLREPVPDYWSARSDIPELEGKAQELADIVATIRSELAAQDGLLRNLAGSLAPPSSSELDIDDIDAKLTAASQQDERSLLNWARRRRDLIGAMEQVRASSIGQADGERRVAEADLELTRYGLDEWLRGDGAELAAVLTELQRSYSDVPGMDSDVSFAQKAAFALVNSERQRVQRVLNTDAEEGAKLVDLRVSIRRGTARIEIIDKELTNAADANEELAQALAALVPHIHDETCPFCERNFNEVSPDQPLAARVANRIAGLVATAGRLQSLARDKSNTATAVSKAQLDADTLESRQLSDERRSELKLQLARLSELELRLQGLGAAAREGAQKQISVTRAAQRIAELGSRDAAVEGFHALAAQLTAEFGVAPVAAGESLGGALQRLHAFAEEMEGQISQRQTSRRNAIVARNEMVSLRANLRARIEAEERVRADLDRLTKAKAEADRRIDLGKDLVHRARDVRTNMVRTVFNDDLNALWKDLFIRLAPDEAFVPAFALPLSSGGPVEAVLETRYRSGGRGGNPRAMLSAGNLNTAALTLFLALHLSARSQLPWLIIDDPVQSMDEVHIAQFAALLRSLKSAQRQVIIAVHERSLFEYLTLELSPTFLDDRLITIELGRGPDGMTIAPWKLRTFLPDRAVAA